MQRLDDSILEQVFAKLSPNALATVEVVCRHWCALITRSRIWQQHACPNKNAGAPTSSSKSFIRAQRPALPDHWRNVCLHRAASAKWRAGRLSLAATLNGHTGPVTCMDVMQHCVLTGSADGTARLWDMRRGVQLHLLQRSAETQPVVAVALVSVSLAVTATAKGGALLWRTGAAIRRFEVMPGGRVTSLALTDTQLLLGSSAGTVQHFDLFSGQQQLITRHSSGVTHLLTHRRVQTSDHQTPQQLQHEEAEEWLILVGCVDGQVCCVGSSTGRLVWQLPTRHPSKVVSLQLVDWQPALHSQAEQQGAQHLQHNSLLLYVLNARSQLICWQLPRAAISPGSQGGLAAAAAAAAAAPSKPGRPGRSTQDRSARAGAVRGTGPDQASGRAAAQHVSQGVGVGQLKMPLWPLSVCSISAPAPSSNQHKQVDATPLEQQQQQQQPQFRVRQAQLAAHNSSTCMLSPVFGKDCLVMGTTLGHLTVACLQQDTGAAQPSNSGSCEHSRAQSTRQPGSTIRGAHTAESSMAASVPRELNPAALTAVQPRPAAEAAPAEGVRHATSGIIPQAMSDVGASQQQQRTARPLDNQQNGGQPVQLQVVRHCSLHKLGKLLAGLQTANITAHQVAHAAAGSAGGAAAVERTKAAAETGTGGAYSSAEPPGQEHVFSGSKVYCMKFAPNGLLVVGLGSGHVCCLKFKHPASSPWA